MFRCTTRVQHQTRGLREDNDARTGMPTGIPVGAMCVQRFDDSRKFCNSHYLSHFAAFFIDARTKRSVVESFSFVLILNQVHSDDMVWYKSFVVGPSADALQGVKPPRRSGPVGHQPVRRSNKGNLDKGLGGRAPGGKTLTR